jgi:hypothetical protein
LNNKIKFLALIITKNQYSKALNQIAIMKETIKDECPLPNEHEFPF